MQLKLGGPEHVPCPLHGTPALFTGQEVGVMLLSEQSWPVYSVAGATWLGSRRHSQVGSAVADPGTQVPRPEQGTPRFVPSRAANPAVPC